MAMGAKQTRTASEKSTQTVSEESTRTANAEESYDARLRRLQEHLDACKKLSAELNRPRNAPTGPVEHPLAPELAEGLSGIVMDSLAAAKIQEQMHLCTVENYLELATEVSTFREKDLQILSAKHTARALCAAGSAIATRSEDAVELRDRADHIGVRNLLHRKNTCNSSRDIQMAPSPSQQDWWACIEQPSETMRPGPLG